MSQARILLFDSGMGGLTVARSVRHELPFAHLVYSADNAAFHLAVKLRCFLVLVIFFPHQRRVEQGIVARKHGKLLQQFGVVTFHGLCARKHRWRRDRLTKLNTP